MASRDESDFGVGSMLEEWSKGDDKRIISQVCSIESFGAEKGK
jgi:hypothetical protein